MCPLGDECWDRHPREDVKIIGVDGVDNVWGESESRKRKRAEASCSPDAESNSALLPSPPRMLVVCTPHTHEERLREYLLEGNHCILNFAVIL